MFRVLPVIIHIIYFEIGRKVQKVVLQSLFLISHIMYAFNKIAAPSFIFFCHCFSFIRQEMSRDRKHETKSYMIATVGTFATLFLSIFERATVRKGLCAWLLHDDLKSLIYLIFDVKSNTLTTHNMITQTFHSNIICTKAITTDRDGHLNVQKQISTEHRRIHFHSFYVENGNKCNGDMVFEVQK